ncbi:MAG: divergent PAP2 family protein [Candidatus Moranbacteria bacterium]|nr:divergent PAP2 family protein [Candidatus Moranbacteria bacterium]
MGEFFSKNGDSYHPIVIIPIIMWMIAQLLKFTIFSVKHGINWKYLFEYGHMPSSHTATMTALIFSTGYYEGIYSPIFAVAFTMGAIVMSDAVKLRGYIGEYGKVLNQLTKKQKENYPRLKERVGHTVREVVSGALLGLVGAFLLIQLFNLFLNQ